MKVIDLFCGCGGISLGFQLAGFDVIYGLDNNKDAILTFARNFPNATACCESIENIDISSIPDADVIVGGPPCVNFSTSKGSRANVLEGLKLVQFFLKIVYLKNPKYWIMENVPRIGLHLPDKIPLKWIGIDEDGYLNMPNKHEFDISLYGAPQKRKRLLIGKYPFPKPTHTQKYNSKLMDKIKNSVKTLGEVIESFPDPLSRPNSSIITDPNYFFELNDANLTDHYMDTMISDEEADRIEQVKTNHPYMGKMAFPDDLNKPARTVVALQMGRETLVLKTDNSKYRRLTVRECATLQTFPINFQFGGKTTNSRYKQAGNAVPPILTWNIANAILLEDKNIKQHEFQIMNVEPFPVPIERKKTIRRPNFSSSRIIRIPHKEVRGARVELTSRGYPETEWVALLHLGEGKQNHQVIKYDMKSALAMAKSSITNSCDMELFAQFKSMMACLGDMKFDNASYIHEYIHINKKYPECINSASDLLENFFPSSKFSKYDLFLHNKIPGIDKKKLRVRVVVSIVLLKHVELCLGNRVNFDSYHIVN